MPLPISDETAGVEDLTLVLVPTHNNSQLVRIASQQEEPWTPLSSVLGHGISTEPLADCRR